MCLQRRLGAPWSACSGSPRRFPSPRAQRRSPPPRRPSDKVSVAVQQQDRGRVIACLAAVPRTIRTSWRPPAASRRAASSRRLISRQGAFPGARAPASSPPALSALPVGRTACRVGRPWGCQHPRSQRPAPSALPAALAEALAEAMPHYVLIGLELGRAAQRRATPCHAPPRRALPQERFPPPLFRSTVRVHV